MKKNMLGKYSVGLILIILVIFTSVVTFSSLKTGAGLKDILLTCKYKTISTQTENSAPKLLNQKYNLIQIGNNARNAGGYEGILEIGSESQVGKSYSISELNKKDIQDELYKILNSPNSFERIYISKYFKSVPLNLKIERMNVEFGNYTLSVDTFKYDNGGYNGNVVGGYNCSTLDDDIKRDVGIMLQGFGLTIEQYNEIFESVYPIKGF
jgi:hypothetical protein